MIRCLWYVTSSLVVYAGITVVSYGLSPGSKSPQMWGIWWKHFDVVYITKHVRIVQLIKCMQLVYKSEASCHSQDPSSLPHEQTLSFMALGTKQTSKLRYEPTRRSPTQYCPLSPWVSLGSSQHMGDNSTCLDSKPSVYIWSLETCRGD